MISIYIDFFRFVNLVKTPRGRFFGKKEGKNIIPHSEFRIPN